MFDTTSAVALTTPSCLRREGLPVATTQLFYRVPPVIAFFADGQTP
jgi:hypothetical protein